jgi:hypothetical protein
MVIYTGGCCDGDPRPPTEVGSCCLPNGRCAEGITRAACKSKRGNFHPDYAGGLQDNGVMKKVELFIQILIVMTNQILAIYQLMVVVACQMEHVLRLQR